jgi:hypothetical protein
MGRTPDIGPHVAGTYVAGMVRRWLIVVITAAARIAVRLGKLIQSPGRVRDRHGRAPRCGLTCLRRQTWPEAEIAAQ